MSTEIQTRSKKILSIFIAFMIFFTAFAAIPMLDIGTVYGAEKKGKVTATSVNVRSGPGKKYNKIGTLAKGKNITVKGSKKDKNGTKWYRIKYKSKTGYVSSKYVDIKKITVTPLSGLRGTVKIKKGVLNIRSGPGSSYKKLGSYKKGKKFKITGKAKSANGVWWYQFKYKKKKAYVNSKYVKTSPINKDKLAAVTFQVGITTADGGLNVRSGAGTSYSRLTMLPEGSTVVITGSVADSNGKPWYTYQFSAAQSGYICSDYVTVRTITSDLAFEEYLAAQGFPESYKPYLRVLHADHPQWLFQAINVGYDWSAALSAESILGRNLVSASSPVSYRSTVSGAYNAATGTWTKFDGSWYAANQTVIAYYMDPRNFFTENGIYQFMTHSYDAGSQNANTVAAVIQGSFMESAAPGSGYTSYAELINAAGQAAGVNPNVLAAMIIQEQGWTGSSLVSGTYTGYEGYYNFFNVGAYTTANMNAVQRGLWYAKGSGTGATTYSRPWNTPYSSIKGGAEFYAEGYVSNNQDSYYAKKFNVYNGVSNVGLHQYMTNVAAAASEGGIVKRAYAANSAYPVVFEIPVYNNIPATNCPLP